MQILLYYYEIYQFHLITRLIATSLVFASWIENMRVKSVKPAILKKVLYISTINLFMRWNVLSADIVILKQPESSM